MFFPGEGRLSCSQVPQLPVILCVWLMPCGLFLIKFAFPTFQKDSGDVDSSPSCLYCKPLSDGAITHLSGSFWYLVGEV